MTMNATLRTVDFLVRRELKSPGAPPIIGVIDLRNPDKALGALIDYLSGDSNNLAAASKNYPYATCWAIATVLRRNYGAEENHAVYAPLEVVLRIPLPLNGIGRSVLREGFDALCQRMGISTVGYDRHVDLYLAQAGVPEGMLGHLATAFLRQERYVGPPSVESSQDLNEWEDEALELLPPGVRTPRLPVILDETGWHAALYAEIRNGIAVREGRFEAAFRAAIDAQADKVSSGSAAVIPRPRLRWHDGGLGLDVPRLEGRLRFWPEPNGPMLRLRGGEVWRLSEPWPVEMRWQSGDHHDEIAFLRDPTSVAIFDRQSGRFLREVLPKGQSERLDAVEIIVLSRQHFIVDGKASHMLGDEAHAAILTLTARPFPISTAGGSLKLALRPRRRITAVGGIVATGPQGALYGSGAQFRIETGQMIAEERVLKIIAAGRQATLPLFFDGSGVLSLALDDIMSELDAAGPSPLTDPLRLRMELPGPAERDAAASAGIVAAFWVWPSAAIVDRGFLFEATRPPTNLALDHCRHVLRDNRGQVCLDPVGGYARARLAFEINSVIAAFDLLYPDVTCVRHTADGREHFLPFGAQIVLREEERFDTVTIRCPDPEADLLVRGKVERTPFLEGRPRNIALRDLMRAARDDRVVVRKGNGAEIELFRVVQALSPNLFDVRLRNGVLQLTIEMPDRIDAFCLAIEDELGAWTYAEVALGHRPVNDCTPAWLTGEVPSENWEQARLRIKLKEFSEGLHLAQVLIRPVGQETWKRLGNLRGDVFALVIDGGGVPAPDDLARRFETLSRWMAHCYSREAWAYVERLVPRRWQELGLQLLATPEGPSALLAAAMTGPSEDAASLWVPIAHPLTFLPELYGVPSEHFAALAAREDEGAAALSIVSEVSSGRLRDKEALDPAALLGFANVQKADQTQEQLRDFNPKRFLSLLEHPHLDRDPAAGWFWRGKPLLGPGHWRAAHLRFAERLEAAGLFVHDDADEQTQNALRQASLQKLMSANLRNADLKPPVPKREITDEEPAMVDLWAATTLCKFAKEARAGSTTGWASRTARELRCSPDDVLRDVAFLLRLAPELFAFYMGIWQLTYR